VEKLWKAGGKAVSERPLQIFLAAARTRLPAFLHVEAPSRAASLDLFYAMRKIDRHPVTFRHRTVNAHRFEQTIAGRPYLIEVTPVHNRWRAQLLRKPGVPTAMMPFYGPTPDEAAKQLTDWLTLAHRRHAASAV
jgi:hypothetical protein